MQKRSVLLVIIFCSLSIFRGHSQNLMDPVEMNDRFVVILDSLHGMSKEWHKSFYEIDKGSKQYADLKPVRTVWQSYVERELVELKSIKDTGGSAKFRGAVYMLLFYQKQYIANAIIPFEKLSIHTTMVQMKPFNDRLLEISKKEKEYLNNVNTEQNSFAKRNHFNLGEKGSDD